MNRLGVRLALAFLLVTAVAVGAVAVLADWSARNEFARYVARQTEFAQSGQLEALAAFYAARGSWDGVEAVLEAAEAEGSGRGGRNRPTLLLADAAGQVVYDERGQRAGAALTAGERRQALAVTVDGQVVGLVAFQAMEGGGLTPSQEAFLAQLRQSFILAALIAGGLGLALGLVIARSLAAPLAALARSARAFAAHDRARRAPVGGTAETADVARAFNEMADEVQRAEALRRSLTADIAHELRTPLTVLQGNLRALLDGVYPLERGEVATLYDQTRLLARLVDDLRELSLADAGQLPLRLQAVDPAALLHAALDRFAEAAAAKGVRLVPDFSPPLPAVRADPDRAAQILTNLLANALRHTPAGGQITLAAASEASGVRVRVVDTGDGIPAESLPHVFDRFYRADAARTRAGGGTGLGLAIARAWAQAMGGRIGVESEPGRGSTFWFTLPG